MSGLVREVEEETGISLKLENKEPFLCVEQFMEKYLSSNSEEVSINKRTKTYYYMVEIEEGICESKMKLSDRESENGVTTTRIGMDKIIELLNENNTGNPRNKYFTRELITVVNELNLN